MRSVSESRSAFRHQVTQLFADVPDEIVAEFRVAELEGTTPPWLDTGLKVCAGDQVTTILCGRVFLAEAEDLWIDPVPVVNGMITAPERPDHGLAFRPEILRDCAVAS